GSTYGQAQTMFDKLCHLQEVGQMGMMGPFNDREEWELAEWLFKSGTSQTQMDKYLKLNIVCVRTPCILFITRNRTSPSYKDKRSLLKKIDELPQGSSWQSFSFTVTGDKKDYNGELLTEEVMVWAHDPVEVVKELIGNPMFRDYMKYTPEKLYGDEEMTKEIINEM
ncbi:hypothetical protein M422DRAFT_81572, partial [Sphaerobolus stellatus SS14]